MDEFFKGLVERTHYYEEFETFRKNPNSCEELTPKIEEKKRNEKVFQMGKNS